MISEEIIIEINDKKIINRVDLSRAKRMVEEYWVSTEENNRHVYFTSESNGELPENSTILFNALFSPSKLTIESWDKDKREYVLLDILDDDTLERENEEAIDFKSGKLERLILNNRRFLREKYRDINDIGDDYYQHVDFNHEDNAKVIKKILTSFRSYLSFEIDLFKTTLKENLEIEFVEPIVATGFLALYDPNKKNVADSKSQKAILISDIPESKGQTKYNAKYSLSNNLENGFGNIIKPLNTIDPYEDIRNFKTGFLETNYNHNTGMYEGGTRQIIARLLVDLPACEMPELDLENISTDPLVFYNKEFEFNQVGNFELETHSGKALTLNVQKGNPYLFGPNFHRFTKYDKEEGVETVELEKILVVNRTPIAFSANEYIKCSKIDGEWIPEKFVGGVSSSSKFSIKNWSFQKFITDSDSYFRDNRYYNNLPSTDSDNYENILLNPTSYQQRMRNRFYFDLYNRANFEENNLESIAALNFNPLVNRTVEEAIDAANTFISNTGNYDVIPSTRYWQITAFDQMGEFAGGKNDKNIIARTNSVDAPDGLPDEDLIYGKHWMEWWGPSFVDGYKTAQVQELLSENSQIEIRASGQNALEYFFKPGNDKFTASSTELAIVDVAPGQNLDRNWSLEYSSPKGMFGNSIDLTARNLPAEVATNSYPVEGSICSPLEDSKILIQNYGCDLGNYVDMIDATNNIMASGELGIQKRFNWLYKYNEEVDNSGVDNSVYALEPNVPNRIDFFSLPAEVVSSTDYARSTTGESVTRDYGNETLMTEHLRAPKYPDHMLGADFIFQRNSHCGIDHFTQPLIRHTNGAQQGPDNTVVNRTIPHNAYVKKRSVGNLGEITPPLIWSEETADCVGVIASKCTVRFKGQELRFILNQNFGVIPHRQVSAGGGGSFTILGGNILGVTGGSNGFDFTDPRWGGSSDNPESFHTTALHAQIYDAWPAENTIYDGRYFSVFHYNPGECLSQPETLETEITKTDESVVTLEIDQITETVDFRIPTDIDNNPIPVNDPFDSELEMMPRDSWRVNTIRRGMMINNGGFKYIKRYVGLNESAHVENAGTGYIEGDILTATGGTGTGAEFEVTGVDSSGKITNLNILKPGRGYLASDFGTSSEPELSKVKLTGGSGKDIQIKITKGIVYEEIEYDDYPKDRSGQIQLTEGNNRGFGNNNEGPVQGFHEKSFIFSETNDSGEYDIFMYYHNDISHTVYSTEDYFYSTAQHVLLEINAV